MEERIVSNSKLPRRIVPTYSKLSDSPNTKCSFRNLGSEFGQPEPEPEPESNRNSLTSDKSFVLQKKYINKKWQPPEIKNLNYLAQQFLANFLHAILGHFFAGNRAVMHLLIFPKI